MWRLRCRANWQSQRVRYFLRPTKLRWSRKENLREGIKTPGVGLLANTIDGPARPTPLHLGPAKTPAWQRPCAITFSPHRRCPFWKKVWSPTCPLNGSFQSPNCPLRGFFTRQAGFFSRKWPDGGRFFEPCWVTDNLPSVSVCCRISSAKLIALSGTGRIPDLWRQCITFAVDACLAAFTLCCIIQSLYRLSKKTLTSLRVGFSPVAAALLFYELNELFTRPSRPFPNIEVHKCYKFCDRRPRLLSCVRSQRWNTYWLVSATWSLPFKPSNPFYLQINRLKRFLRQSFSCSVAFYKKGSHKYPAFADFGRSLDPESKIIEQWMGMNCFCGHGVLNCSFLFSLQVKEVFLDTLGNAVFERIADRFGWMRQRVRPHISPHFRTLSQGWASDKVAFDLKKVSLMCTQLFERFVSAVDS